MRCHLFAAFAALGALALAAGPSRADDPAAETQARVPELSAFHEVIYPMWHTAWPERDTTMLRALWPDIQRHVAAVARVELPGILRERGEAWRKGVERLRTAERAYGEALAQPEVQPRLNAAEDLHAAYEGLVRAIRPVMPELARFHESLYRLYHHFVPEKDREALRAEIPLLAARMDTLGHAPLPARFAQSAEKIERARAGLQACVLEFVQAVRGESWKEIAAALERMHSAYRSLEASFG